MKEVARGFFFICKKQPAILEHMSEAISPIDPEKIINTVRPNHTSIQWFNGGDNRNVVVVDDTETFRFPKDESGIEVGRYEFEAVKLVQGKLHVAVPSPIELASDGSYNVLGFLQGKVLSKQAVTVLPYHKRARHGA